MITVDAWIELAKVFGSGIVGWAAGRYQDRRSDVRNLQGQITAAIRGLCKDAIEYHSHCDVRARVQQNALLKAKLRQVSTDLAVLSARCSDGRKTYAQGYLELLDATTDYPFDPDEMTGEIDRERLDRITGSSEKLVAIVHRSKVRILTSLC